MFHPRFDARPAADLAFHPQRCACAECSIAHDPIGHRARRRAMTAWAVLFILLASVFYGVVLAQAPAIAASFQVGR